MSSFKIRPVTENDIPDLKCLQLEGWPDIQFHFRFYVNEDFCCPVCLEHEGQIAAVANGLFIGKTGWLAYIITAKEHQRKGFGCALTEYLINFLHDQKVKTQILIATEMGFKLYLKLGFRQTTSYSFYKSAQIEPANTNENIRPLKNTDYPALFELDRKITAEERKPVLEKLGLQGWGIFDNNSNILKGYYLPDIGEGTILAADTQSGLDLLKFKHVRKKCKTVLPRENIAGNKFLVDHGFEKYSECARMILGDDHNWKPENVFSRIGGFYG
jgi:hypothetical protein